MLAAARCPGSLRSAGAARRSATAAAAPWPATPAAAVAAAARLTAARGRNGSSKARLVACQATAANIKQVNAEELEAAIAARDKPTVVDFFATWCGPCLLLAQELEKVASELGDGVQILKLDVDQNPELSTRLQIHGLPTMIFIGTDADKPALRTEGLLPAETIKNIISKEL